MSSRGLTLPGPEDPRSPARRPRRGDWPVCSPDPKVRGAQPIDPEGPTGRLLPRPEGLRSLAGRSRRIDWQVASPDPKVRRSNRFTDPEVRGNGCPALPKERRAIAPLPRRAAERLTRGDAPDLTASPSGRPPHHRRLRRVAPPAWPSSLADPCRCTTALLALSSS
jgi:hypothetical protein